VVSGACGTPAADLWATPLSGAERFALSQAVATPRCPGEEVLGRWIQATLHAAVDEPIALDGKTVRGARKDEQAAPHLLSFCTHERQETLFQVRVSE